MTPRVAFTSRFPEAACRRRQSPRSAPAAAFRPESDRPIDRAELVPDSRRSRAERTLDPLRDAQFGSIRDRRCRTGPGDWASAMRTGGAS
jgi:hypothetical protein